MLSSEFYQLLSPALHGINHIVAAFVVDIGACSFSKFNTEATPCKPFVILRR